MGFLSAIASTKETHRDNELRTKYYKEKKDQAMESIVGLLKKRNFKNIKKVEQYGEISANGGNYNIMITVVMVRRGETAVDVQINGRGFFRFGKPRKFIIEFYNALNGILTFRGVSLNP